MLSIVMSIASVISLNRIGDDVEKITHNSMPSIVSGAALSQSLLEAELSLKQLATVNTIELADTEKNTFEQARSKNKQAINELRSLIQHQEGLLSLFNKMIDADNAFFEKADIAINEYFNVLQLIVRTQELKREFGDMGDESLSLAYDMEGIAEDEAVASQIEEFVTLIESSVDEANSALNSNISFEVRSIQSSLNDSISELDNLFSQIQSASELQGSEDVVGMADNIKRFKEALVGSGNALDSRIMALEQEKKVHELLGEASENGKIVRERLVSLNQAITHYMKEVEEHSTASITTSKSITTILSFITLVLSVVIAYLVVQAINKPLKSVVKQLQLAAKGDMTVHFEKFHDDELGEMADNMQKLVDSLQATLVEIKENSDTLASTAEQTTTISEHSFSSISEQNQQIQMMSTSIEEMTATVDSVAGSIQ